MSCNYAEGLSPYDNKGVLGTPEKFDSPEVVEEKVTKLSEWIKASKHVVVHTGAGISTAAGIPDFRGPNGVWTLEKEGKKPNINISFNDSIPTKTHMALKKLLEAGYIHYIVSQNIDGLHLKSGVERKYIAELHGNMFVEQCNVCDSKFMRDSATSTVGKKLLGYECRRAMLKRRACRGRMQDTILDWEDNLPENDLEISEYHSSVADLNICLGTTLQIVPSGNLPVRCKKFGGRVAIVNLQSTKHEVESSQEQRVLPSPRFSIVRLLSSGNRRLFTRVLDDCEKMPRSGFLVDKDKKADLIINTYVDDVLEKVIKELGLEIPEYSKDIDPTKNLSSDVFVSWAIPPDDIKDMKLKYECKNREYKQKRLDDKNNLEKKMVKSKYTMYDCKHSIISKEETNNETGIKLEDAKPAIKTIDLTEEESDDEMGIKENIEPGNEKVEVDLTLENDLAENMQDPLKLENSLICVQNEESIVLSDNTD